MIKNQTPEPRNQNPTRVWSLGVTICVLEFGFWNLVGAITTSFWEVRDFKDCKLKNVMLDKDGFASLAPKIECVWESPEVYIWAIIEVDKTLYVGTGAEGKIYKIENGKASLLFDTKEAGVFSLALHKRKIYAGTSPNGKIFVIDEKGKGELFKETNEKYIWEIVVDEHNNLYVATGTNGKILKITEKGELDTFYTTQQMNISFLAYFKPYFYAGTGEEGLLFRINHASGADHQGKGFCIWDAQEQEITGVVIIDTLLFVSATVDTQGSIYLVYPDNRVERLWTTKSPIRGIQRAGYKIIAVAGKRVYRIDKKGNTELLAELPTAISCITNNWVGTSEVGKVYKLGQEISKHGSIEAPSYDTKSISKWGRLEIEAVCELPSEIKVRTRTGNTKDPDQTWDEWREVVDGYKLNSPPARFIQWEVTLTSPDSKLKKVKVPFLPQNEKPEILEIKIVTPKVAMTTPKQEQEEKKLLWQAVDPNGDSLIFNLYFRLTAEKEWSLLKESIKDTFYFIDPKSFPDGEYEFRVEASDSPSNPSEYALKSEQISDPYLIDNTPPIIKIGKTENRILYFEVEDSQGVKSCEFAVDGGEWKVTFPIDNLFDSRIEEFKLNVGNARKVVIRAHDIYGNTTLKSELIK